MSAQAKRKVGIDFPVSEGGDADASATLGAALQASTDQDLKATRSRFLQDSRSKLFKAVDGRALSPAVFEAATDPAAKDLFESLFDTSLRVKVLATDKDPIFHEAGVWMPRTCEWLITSNRFKPGTPDTHVRILALHYPSGKVRFLEALEKQIRMANGGTTDFAGGAYLLDQGFGDKSGAIWKLDPLLTNATRIHPLDSQLHNSLNDVVLHRASGMLLFTDPAYGYHVQDFRTSALTHASVWMGKADGTAQATIIDQDYCAPNGILLSPDEKTLYVTDVWNTEWINGEYLSGQAKEHWRQNKGMETGIKSHTVAYDVSLAFEGTVPTFKNRRIFFDLQNEPDASGFPDGIKCDVDGNVYAGCGDGVRVYNPRGIFLGRIKVEGGVANLCFGGPDGKVLLLLSEARAITVQTLKPGALPPYSTM